MFIDHVEIKVKAGDGGNGAVAFRREKFVPKGGPSGGNGGKGGNIYIETSNNLLTLLDFKYNIKFIAEDGDPGGTSLKDGKSGDDIIIKVPVGTMVKDADKDELLYDLDENGKRVLLAAGGRGGKGNSNFATPTNQTPRFAEDGTPGEEKNIVLELKLLADVALVGFPNAGKSTLISVISAAKPKIADYPFTTLTPNLGIVKYKDYKTFVVADIPGLIEGAHTGKGLGIQFLKHIERTKILLIMLDAFSEDYQQDYNILINELKSYNKELSKRKKIVAFTKADVYTEDDLVEVKKRKVKGYRGKPLLISAVSGFGIPELLDTLWENLKDKEK